MANRDKSQNAAFVYTNIYEIYKKSQAAASNLSSDSRVFRAADLEGVKITKFEPRTLTKATPVANQEDLAVKGSPFEDLKANLGKLQDLHSRLRFMLKELEDLVEKK